jgi:hypothetical protein
MNKKKREKHQARLKCFSRFFLFSKRSFAGAAQLNPDDTAELCGSSAAESR